MRASAIIAIALTAFVVLSPLVLARSGVSVADLIPLVAVVLGSGLVLRLRGTGSTRRLGSILSVVGILSGAILVAFMWLLVMGLGRPY
jgi:uncharacterized membrane protein